MSNSTVKLEDRGLCSPLSLGRVASAGAGHATLILVSRDEGGGGGGGHSLLCSSSIFKDCFRFLSCTTAWTNLKNNCVVETACQAVVA